MVGSTPKKRAHADFAPKVKPQKPSKKQKRQQLLAYNSDDSSDDEVENGSNPDFQPVNLLDDSEGEIDFDNLQADDGASSADSGSDAESGSDSEEEESSARQKLKKRKTTTSKALTKVAQNTQLSEEDEGAESEDLYSDADSFDIDDDETGPSKKSKSKRNDPAAFATSLSKILSTKLSSTRREDPLLSRSADAQKAVKEIVDSALDSKVRKQARQQKLIALEKGRVRDVLVATTNEVTGDLESSTASILEQEKRLRKVAQRGVVKLFNAVRMAQVRGQEADAQARKDGFVGIKSREEKVTEMSRKGFLDLIASGGGGLKKGALEEG